jgi:4-alpha-glucanotransferase
MAGWQASASRDWRRRGSVQLPEASARKQPLIEEAAANFLDRANDEQRQRFQRFCEENLSWLTDYAMFNVLRRRFAGASWNEWPEEYAHRKPSMRDHRAAEGEWARARDRAGGAVLLRRAVGALRGYCAERKIRILGDVAIFVNYDSADVWTHPEIFELDETAESGAGVGCAAGLLFRDRAALGQSAVQVAAAAGAGLRLVGGADPPRARAL